MEPVALITRYQIYLNVFIHIYIYFWFVLYPVVIKKGIMDMDPTIQTSHKIDNQQMI